MDRIEPHGPVGVLHNLSGRSAERLRGVHEHDLWLRVGARSEEKENGGAHQLQSALIETVQSTWPFTSVILQVTIMFPDVYETPHESAT